MTNHDFWDRRYSTSDYAYGTLPNDYLRTQAARLPDEAMVLSLADGEGRNSCFLATLGHHVTGVDISREGEKKAHALAAQLGISIRYDVADLCDYELGIAKWDAIVSIFSHLPSSVRTLLRPRILESLKVGGLFILEHYHPRQIEYKTGGPTDVSMLTTLEELHRDFAGFEICHEFEGERDVFEGQYHSGLAYVTQFVARRR